MNGASSDAFVARRRSGRSNDVKRGPPASRSSSRSVSCRWIKASGIQRLEIVSRNSRGDWRLAHHEHLGRFVASKRRLTVLRDQRQVVASGIVNASARLLEITHVVRAREKDEGPFTSALAKQDGTCSGDCPERENVAVGSVIFASTEMSRRRVAPSRSSVAFNSRPSTSPSGRMIPESSAVSQQL